jgi:hypothetical protein
VLGPHVSLYDDKIGIPDHYVFDRKYNKDGSMKKLKICVIANGDKQI